MNKYISCILYLVVLYYDIVQSYKTEICITIRVFFICQGLETIAGPGDASQLLRPLSHDIAAPRIDSYRFSMANLEDSQDVDLDAILGELCALETRCDEETRALRAGIPPKRVSQAGKKQS